MTTILGHNPGNAMVKDAWFHVETGQSGVLAPYQAVIHPIVEEQSFGMGRQVAALRADIRDGKNMISFLGGDRVARNPGAIRQPVNGRIAPDSMLYPSFAQMSFKMVTGAEGADVHVVSALPSMFMNEENIRQLEKHVRKGLAGLAAVRSVLIRNEAAALLYHELLTDAGERRRERTDLIGKDEPIVLAADIGGGTMNHVVLQNGEPLPGQADSPELGSLLAIERLAKKTRRSLVDCERDIRAATSGAGSPEAKAELDAYRRSVVGHLQRVWSQWYRSASLILVGGGTAHWVIDYIREAFPSNKITLVGGDPQMAIAVGLCRYGVYKYRSSHAKKATGS